MISLIDPLDHQLPSPRQTFLASLTKHKELIIQLLESLPDMFKKVSLVNSLLEQAIYLTEKIIEKNGGQIFIFQGCDYLAIGELFSARNVPHGSL